MHNEEQSLSLLRIYIFLIYCNIVDLQCVSFSFFFFNSIEMWLIYNVVKRAFLRSCLGSWWGLRIMMANLIIAG